MSINKTPSNGQSAGYERPLFERDADAYKAKGKLPEPTICPQCGAVYHVGRWQWGEVSASADREICPACHRINDNFPAGFVTLDGPFFKDHVQEIISLINNHEQHERAEHPLKRIVNIERQGEAMLVTTTDTHLARGIGEAVRHAYQGDLKVDHVSGESSVRVHWHR